MKKEDNLLISKINTNDYNARLTKYNFSTQSTKYKTFFNNKENDLKDSVVKVLMNFKYKIKPNSCSPNSRSTNEIS